MAYGFREVAPLIRLGSALLALVLLAPVTMAEDAAPYAPSLVRVQDPASTLAALSWLPGSELADSFRVYGSTGSGLVLLLDTAETQAPGALAAVVPGGYEGYAVSGVQGGVESAPVLAFATPCRLYVETTPHPRLGFENCPWVKASMLAKVAHP